MDSWFFLPFVSPAPVVHSSSCGSGRDEEPSGDKSPPPDSDPFSDAESGENNGCQSSQFAADADSSSKVFSGSFRSAQAAAGHSDCRRDLAGLYLVCSTARDGSRLL